MDTLIIFTAQYLFAVVVVGTLSFGLMLPKEKRLPFFITAAVAGVIALVLTKLAGALYFDPRPFTHGVHALIPHDADNGFPSDHTVLSALAGMLVYVYAKRPGLLLIGLALLVGMARIAAGIHSPLDIIAAIIIALVSVILAQRAFPLVKKVLPRLSV